MKFRVRMLHARGYALPFFSAMINGSPPVCGALAAAGTQPHITSLQPDAALRPSAYRCFVELILGAPVTE